VCGEFTPNRRMKRIANRNNDLNVAIVKNIDRDEHFAIYERYVNMRHIDGDMYPATRAQYDGFLSSEWDVTQFIEYRLGGKLIGAAVTDILDDGFAAIYTYFDPDHEQRSLGVFSILAQIKLCKEMGLPFVYLGYWIKACKKMSYKIEYRPAQVRIDERWLTLT
jgi:arginine-tRNA-protein transferase